MLTPEDIHQRSNATKPVDCEERHTAETFTVGELPAELHDVGYESAELGAFAYDTCGERFETFLDADESLVMRTIVSWAWFRPSEQAWEKGARWYRCDVVGGGEQSKRFVELPPTARGLLEGKPKDKWLVCVNGDSVQSHPRSRAPSRTCGARSRRSRSASRTTPTRVTGSSRSPRATSAPTGGCLARLPGRVRLRLHLVPRGGVEGRQPSLGLLGEDLGVSRLGSACCSSPPSG